MKLLISMGVFSKTFIFFREISFSPKYFTSMGVGYLVGLVAGPRFPRPARPRPVAVWTGRV
jgi:hypothetical protein